MKDKLRLLFITSIISLMAISCSTTSVQSYDQKPNAKVVVIGVGSDLASAKSAAIRAAMALRTDQIIISEQLLVNDDMKTDLLASSMRGELSFFKVLDQTIDENGFIKIMAEVGISRKELRQKKSAYNANNRNRFNSTEISNKIFSAKDLKEAKELHKKTRKENAESLTSNLFSGYSHATQAQLDKIKIDPANPETIVLKLSYKLKKDWTQNLEEQLELIQSLWSNKFGFFQNNHTYYEHIIRLCRKSAFVGCMHSATHLPIKPKSQNWKIRIFIPVFSSSGNYMTCLKTGFVSNLVWEDESRYSWKFRKGYSFFSYEPSSESYNLNVESKKLYSSAGKAEFFYPKVVSGNAESTDSMCELEGRKMHAASGNALRTVSRK